MDFIIQCGDLCHNAPTATEIQDIYVNNKYKIPALSCLGNHEVEDAESVESVCKAYNMPNNYMYVDINNFRIIILDTNHFIDDDGSFLHNQPYSHRAPNGDRVGEEQLKWLEETINSTDNTCMIFSHASFVDDGHSPDTNNVREIIRRANGKKKGKVMLCCSGHHHTNGIDTVENVVFFDVNATVNVFWSSTENPLWPEEFKDSARMTKNCCFSKDPLSAIVTVCDDGNITISGCESEYLYGISPEMYHPDTANRFGRKPCTKIDSAEIKLDM